MLKNTKSSIKIVFFGALCKRTGTPKKDRKMDLSSSISIFSCRVWTTMFWLAVLEIITTQNTNFSCVRRETKKKKGKRKTREALHKCLCFAPHSKKRLNSFLSTESEKCLCYKINDGFHCYSNRLTMRLIVNVDYK